MTRTREEALTELRQTLTQKQKELLALVISQTKAQGSYHYTDQVGSYWEDDVTETLTNLISELSE